MFKKADKKANRAKRHLRVRKKVSGTPERPRLSVYRSEKNIQAQIIDDINAVTLVSASTLDKEVKAQLNGLTKKEESKIVGEVLAKKALAKGIDTVVFDRGGYIYTGRVESLADGAREAGLKF